MFTLHPQYIKDTAGKNLVVLPQNEFESLLKELEELDDVRAYDEAKKKDTGDRIAMEDAFEMIESNRKKKA